MITRIKPKRFLLCLTGAHQIGDTNRITLLQIHCAPDMVLFTNDAVLKNVYWDHECNQKLALYETGALGCENLFTIKDGIRHGIMREVLGGPPVCCIYHHSSLKR